MRDFPQVITEPKLSDVGSLEGIQLEIGRLDESRTKVEGEREWSALAFPSSLARAFLLLLLLLRSDASPSFALCFLLSSSSTSPLSVCLLRFLRSLFFLFVSFSRAAMEWCACVCACVRARPLGAKPINLTWLLVFPPRRANNT